MLPEEVNLRHGNSLRSGRKYDFASIVFQCLTSLSTPSVHRQGVCEIAGDSHENDLRFNDTNPNSDSRWQKGSR